MFTLKGAEERELDFVGARRRVISMVQEFLGELNKEFHAKCTQRNSQSFANKE